MVCAPQQSLPLRTNSNHITYVLGAAESDTGDAGNVLQAKLGNGLASLLLATGGNVDSRAGGDGGLSLGLGVAALNVGLGDLLIGKLFNTGIGHCECVVGDLKKSELRVKELVGAQSK